MPPCPHFDLKIVQRSKRQSAVAGRRAAVTNTGETAGVAVPQVYVRDEFSSTLKPRRQLAAFTRVELAPGETKEFTLTVGAAGRCARWARTMSGAWSRARLRSSWAKTPRTSFPPRR